ncbi:Zinc finger protein 569 [Plakobranchus ocellatus]|uniref:Zinc finger protein 569 n=1 Tax=Plakobranchus ocellatus TaxID=259542 RepID=A0AAV4DTI1_9GAST|nr:Zinc finger protein 569 [Plakobranchus ocellatus]
MAIQRGRICSDYDFVTSKERKLVKHMKKSKWKSAVKCPFCENIFCGGNATADISGHKKHHHGSVRLGCFLCKFSSRSLTKWARHITQNHTAHFQALVSLSSVENVHKPTPLTAECKSHESKSHDMKDISENKDNLSLRRIQNMADSKPPERKSHLEKNLPHESDVYTEHSACTSPNKSVIASSGETFLTCFEEARENSHPSEKTMTSPDSRRKFELSNMIMPATKRFVTSQTNETHCVQQSADSESMTEVLQDQGSQTQGKPLGNLCPYCDFMYLSIKELRNHCKEKHVHGSTYPCQICRYAAVSVSKLVRHMEVHNKTTQSKSPKPVPCPYCDVSFPSLQELGRHCKVKHGEGAEHKCQYCYYSTKWLYLLVRHMRIHAQKKPFACRLCSYRVCHYTDLYRHMRMHRGERPFECPQCPYKATQAGHLTRHIRWHTGEKPIKCPRCPEHFADYAGRRRHQLKGDCLGSFSFKQKKRL